MRISTKGRYAVRMMLDLAMQESGIPVSIKDIAARQQISEKYMEQIIAMLSKAGFVKSIRGAQGGYILRKEPQEYSIGMILRAAEGSLAPVECLDGGECQKKDKCVTVKVWEKVDKAVNDVVDNITIADLIEWQNESL